MKQQPPLQLVSTTMPSATVTSQTLQRQCHRRRHGGARLNKRTLATSAIHWLGVLFLVLIVTDHGICAHQVVASTRTALQQRRVLRRTFGVLQRALNGFQGLAATDSFQFSTNAITLDDHLREAFAHAFTQQLLQQQQQLLQGPSAHPIFAESDRSQLLKLNTFMELSSHSEAENQAQFFTAVSDLKSGFTKLGESLSSIVDIIAPPKAGAGAAAAAANKQQQQNAAAPKNPLAQITSIVQKADPQATVAADGGQGMFKVHSQRNNPKGRSLWVKQVQGLWQWSPKSNSQCFTWVRTKKPNCFFWSWDEVLPVYQNVINQLQQGDNAPAHIQATEYPSATEVIGSLGYGVLNGILFGAGDLFAAALKQPDCGGELPGKVQGATSALRSALQTTTACAMEHFGTGSTGQPKGACGRQQSAWDASLGAMQSAFSSCAELKKIVGFVISLLVIALGAIPLVGAAVGSAIPVVGTAIGAGVGVAAKLFMVLVSAAAASGTMVRSINKLLQARARCKTGRCVKQDVRQIIEAAAEIVGIAVGVVCLSGLDKVIKMPQFKALFSGDAAKFKPEFFDELVKLNKAAKVAYAGGRLTSGMVPVMGAAKQASATSRTAAAAEGAGTLTAGANKVAATAATKPGAVSSKAAATDATAAKTTSAGGIDTSAAVANEAKAAQAMDGMAASSAQQACKGGKCTRRERREQKKQQQNAEVVSGPGFCAGVETSFNEWAKELSQGSGHPLTFKDFYQCLSSKRDIMPGSAFDDKHPCAHLAMTAFQHDQRFLANRPSVTFWSGIGFDVQRAFAAKQHSIVLCDTLAGKIALGISEHKLGQRVLVVKDGAAWQQKYQKFMTGKTLSAKEYTPVGVSFIKSPLASGTDKGDSKTPSKTSPSLPSKHSNRQSQPTTNHRNFSPKKLPFDLFAVRWGSREMDKFQTMPAYSGCREPMGFHPSMTLRHWNAVSIALAAYVSKFAQTPQNPPTVYLLAGKFSTSSVFFTKELPTLINGAGQHPPARHFVMDVRLSPQARQGSFTCETVLQSIHGYVNRAPASTQVQPQPQSHQSTPRFMERQPNGGQQAATHTAHTQGANPTASSSATAETVAQLYTCSDQCSGADFTSGCQALAHFSCTANRACSAVTRAEGGAAMPKVGGPMPAGSPSSASAISPTTPAAGVGGQTHSSHPQTTHSTQPQQHVTTTQQASPQAMTHTATNNRLATQHRAAVTTAVVSPSGPVTPPAAAVTVTVPQHTAVTSAPVAHSVPAGHQRSHQTTPHQSHAVNPHSATTAAAATLVSASATSPSASVPGPVTQPAAAAIAPQHAAVTSAPVQQSVSAGHQHSRQSTPHQAHAVNPHSATTAAATAPAPAESTPPSTIATVPEQLNATDSTASVQRRRGRNRRRQN
jgi:hypothetical protein